MLESELLNAFMQMAHVYRWLARHVRNSRGEMQGDPGDPDILACRPPRLALIELKQETAPLGPLQEIWRRALEECPGIEYRVFRPSDLRTGRIEEFLR